MGTGPRVQDCLSQGTFHAVNLQGAGPRSPARQLRGDLCTLYLMLFEIKARLASISSIFKMFILFLRESMSGGGAEREGDRGSEAGSELTAGSPTQGSSSRIVRS